MDVHGATVSAETTKNKGAISRFNRSKFGKSFECYGRIHSEIFEQKKLLLSKITLGLKLHRSDPKFLFMAQEATEQYNINLDRAMLIVNVKKIASHVRTAHEARLLTTNAKYPLRQVQMKFFTRGANRGDLSEPNLVNGVLPKKVVIGLVDTDAFNGDYQKNPFNFKHFNVNYVAMRRNGQSIPFEALDLNYKSDETFLGYFTIMQSLGLWGKDRSNNIHPINDFPHGFALYGFDLSPDGSDGSNFNLIKEGNLSLTLRLQKPAAESITIVCYMEFETILEIDRDRNIHYNE